MNKLEQKAKKMVSYYENMTNLKYDLKPYLKQKDIIILHVDTTCDESTIKSILYTFSFYTCDHKYNNLLEFDTYGVKFDLIEKERGVI